MTNLIASIETWPLATAFNISRGAKTQADIVIATVQDGAFVGRGECVPYARYGETLEGVSDAINELAQEIENGLTRTDLQLRLPPGAARNAIDGIWRQNETESVFGNLPIAHSRHRSPLPSLFLWTQLKTWAKPQHVRQTGHC